MRLLICFAAFAIISLPVVVSAQIVTCQEDCGWAEFIGTANRLLDWLVGFLSILAVIALVFAGFKLVTSGGNQEAWRSAKSMFTNVVLGIILVLAAWLIVDTLLSTLTGGGINRWLPQDATSASTSETEQRRNTSSEVTGDLASYGGYQFDSGVVNNMRYISENFDLRVSGGYRTEERNAEVNGAANSYHLTGRAGDFVGPRSDMEDAKRWAEQNGAREALIHNAGSGTHLHVAF